MSVVHLNINGKEVKGNEGQTILDIARANNIEIPTMCFDERVEIYGSCGLCVVEVEGIPKLLRSCATIASDGMIINTNTDRVRSSRKTALELLLSDHVGDCRPPCVLACPGYTDCQGYVGLAANMEYREGLKLIKEVLPLPACIGRVCPHPCEDACRRELVEEPISIGYLKSFLADIDLASDDVYMPEIGEPTGKKIAVIGGGPGGLSAAHFLRVAGHEVTIYEQMPEMGGMLRYGIPEYRLPGRVIDQEVELIRKLDVRFVNNVKVGEQLDLSYIRNNFDACYISIGAWKSTSLRVKGEDMPGVIGGIDFLRKATINEHMKIGERVAVVGGGNTAMDACRTAVRLGAKEVYVLYRRTEEEMPAELIEIREAKEEGVIFKFLVAPVEIIEENGKAGRIKLQKMELGEEDASGRRRPIPIEGDFEYLDIDLVIGAIGQESSLEGFEILEKTKKGTISVDENSFQTNIEGIFAGGDVINQGANIAIKAVGDAKRAVDVINSYLEGHVIPYRRPFVVERTHLTREHYKDRPKEYRSQMPHLSPEERKNNFNEVNLGFTEEQAVKDASRCLECGCHDFFECKLYNYSNEYEVEPGKYDGEIHYREEDDSHPFIIRNTDKCILCGLCVRVCDQVMDNGALGLVERGFDTIVKPALDLNLADTSCIACGQCVSVCPVGALQERLQIDKSVPLETEKTKTICSFCSVGCNIDLETRGDMLYRAIPDKNSEVDEGLLCVKGRFGYNQSKQKTRLSKPLVRVEGELSEGTWDQGLRMAAKKMQSLVLQYGPESVAVSISDRMTNEEIYIAKKFATDFLGTKNVTCFNRTYGGIEDVLGYDASTNTFEEIRQSDFILVIGSEMMKDHTIAALKVKDAVDNGARMVVINNGYDKINEWSASIICPYNDLSCLKGILKVMIDKGYSPQNAIGFEELRDSLEGYQPRPEAIDIAELYLEAKKPVIIFDQNYITVEAARLIADIAVVSGHIGKPRRGIVQLKPKNNSQGVADLGVDMPWENVVDGIKSRKIRGLMSFGEDIPVEYLEGLEFLAVQDLYLTPSGEKADVVLPAVSYAESKGTFTNTERRIQWTNTAIPPLTGYSNWQVVNEMMHILGRINKYKKVEELTEELSKAVPEYKNLFKLSGATYWPTEGPEILYTKGFNFEDGKARLMVVEDTNLFDQAVSTDYVEREFEKFIEEK
ncbi:MAG: FAD-dependent oxidoreductase [Gudongella sp.]|jgi:formate dehydrogenase major subunit|nr:FAD-dependent oxidoreductase [Gudongella sp.]